METLYLEDKQHLLSKKLIKQLQLLEDYLVVVHRQAVYLVQEHLKSLRIKNKEVMKILYLS